MSKPIIRHCKNCEYADNYPLLRKSIHCGVKYKWIGKQRFVALFCRFFKAKGGEG